MRNNDGIVLESFFRYINEVYSIGKRVKAIRDERRRKSVKTSVCAYLLLFSFVLQVSSFNRMNYLLTRNKQRFAHLFPKGTHLPKIDAIRDVVKSISMADVGQLLDGVIKTAIENKVLRENTINGYRVAAIDGVELFSSEKKECEDCLTREVNGVEQHFHKAVVCMTVGADPHIVLGAEMLGPKQDEAAKNEGEQTGAKRLLKRLRTTHHHFADIIVADALYMNAPFINLVVEMGMDCVIRAKDERLEIVKDAMGLYAKREANEVFQDTKKTVKVWDDGFTMNGTSKPIRFLKFIETWKGPKGKEQKREMWAITTLPKGVSAHTVWLVMVKRWDIENNGFRMLKTYFHADHCYVHAKGACEKILLFILTAFNLLELFLFRRLKDFRAKRMLRIDILTDMFDELLLYDFSRYFSTA